MPNQKQGVGAKPGNDMSIVPFSCDYARNSFHTGHSLPKWATLFKKKKSGFPTSLPDCPSFLSLSLHPSKAHP